MWGVQGSEGQGWNSEKRPCHQAYQVRKTWHSTFLPEFSIYSTIFLDFFRKKDGEIKKIEYDFSFSYLIRSYEKSE